MRFFLFFAVFLIAQPGLLHADEYTVEAARHVVVVANSREPESIELAKYYMEKRAIPEANLILLDTPSRETTNWETYVTAILNPLREKLTAGGWLDATASDLTDVLGRRRYVINGHKIRYLVLCRGIPLRLTTDGERLRLEENVPAPQLAQLNNNRCSVDSELSAMAMTDSPTKGMIRNPLFGKQNPMALDLMSVIKVARLDGPSYADARRLVDNALEGEKNGLLGRAYFDIANRHKQGDDWIRNAASGIGKLGFDIDVDENPQTLRGNARFDAPALYFGWYAGDANGPFKNPGFRFPPGAIAVHIHSFSATTLQSQEEKWCGPLVARGVAVTLGNTWEPYLHLTHHLNAFVGALAFGWPVGDATYFSQPALSWQTVLIGDPLYRPFLVPLDEQVAKVESGTNAPTLTQYAVIRKMNLLRQEGKLEEAIALGRRAVRRTPGLALAYSLAQAHAANGQNGEAVNALLFTTGLTYFSADDWILARDAAGFLAKMGRADAATAIFKNLLNTRNLPPEVERSILAPAIETAGNARQRRLSSEWKRRLADLNKPE